MELSSHYNFFNHTLILYVERLNYNFTWQMRLLGQGGVCEGHVGQPQSERRVWAGEHLSVTVFFVFSFFQLFLYWRVVGVTSSLFVCQVTTE